MKKIFICHIIMLMIEYRLYSMPDNLRDALTNADAFIAEEDFSGKTTYLIYSDEDISDILNSLNVPFEWKLTEETGWQERWKEFIQEDWLTDTLYFVFEKGKTFNDNRETVYINPSLAFGTGAHPTTKIAARLLEPVIKGKTMLDTGAGSGILSITASLKGAVSVDAFDIDASTLPNCLENIKENGCDNINAAIGEIKDIKDRRYDIVCANIISSVLLSIHSDVERLAGEYIVYSGILDEEYETVSKDLIHGNWVLDERIVIDEWSGMRLKKC